MENKDVIGFPVGLIPFRTSPFRVLKICAQVAFEVEAIVMLAPAPFNWNFDLHGRDAAS